MDENETFEEYQERLRKLRVMERYDRDGFFRTKATREVDPELEALLY